jgi:hypothetical protein
VYVLPPADAVQSSIYAAARRTRITMAIAIPTPDVPRPRARGACGTGAVGGA